MFKDFIKVSASLGALTGIILIVFELTNHPKTPATAEQVWDMLEFHGFESVDTTRLYQEDWGENAYIPTQSVGAEMDDIHFDFFVFNSDKSADDVRGIYQSWIRDHRYCIPNVEIKEGMANYTIYTLKGKRDVYRQYPCGQHPDLYLFG